MHILYQTNDNDMISTVMGGVKLTFEGHQRVTNQWRAIFTQPVMRRIQFVLALFGILIGVALLLTA